MTHYLHRRGFLVLLLLGIATITGFAQAAEHTKDSLDTVKKAVAEQKAILLDVREQSEWDAGHLKDAKLLPLSTLKGALKPEELARVLPKDKVIYCHCAAGGRCLIAGEALKKLGYDVRPLKPGFKDLLQAGFPQAPK